ncbi:MAG: 16S rRNA methyltransferase, partial [Acidobacteriota bacterium]
MDPAVDKVLASLHKSRRYGSLYEPLLRRIAVESLEIENGKIRPAAKRAKRRLHQVFGAYLPQRP